MKQSQRWLTFVSLVVSVMFVGVAAAQGPQLAPEGEANETYNAPFPVHITLDGDFNDWNGVPRVQMGQGVGRPAVNFAAAADQENLYLWGEVIDDNIISGEHEENYWNEDSLEFYLNGTGDLDLTSYTDGIAQLTIPPLNIGAASEDMVFAGVNYESLNADVIVVETNRGWAVEVAIPLKSDTWEIVPEQDLQMGFQVHLNAASESNRDTKLIWSKFDTSDASYQNPSVFGRLTFYEVASEPEMTGEYFFRSELSEDGLVDDFENGIWMGNAGPDSRIGLVPGDSTTLAIQQVLPETALALPEQDTVKNILAVQYDAEDSSYTHAFTNGLNATTQDWSVYNALGMWLYGTGAPVDVIVNANGTYRYNLEATQSGWQYIIIPFTLFTNEADDDALDASAVEGYGVSLSSVTTSGTLYLDTVQLYIAEDTSVIHISDAHPLETFIVDESIGWESREWNLVWSDDFDGDSGEPINDEYWTCEIGGEGWGNNEWEYYTTSLDNVSQTGDGTLAITALRGQPENGDRCWYGQCAFTSARCTTQDKVEFTYGRVEARIKIPGTQAIWPAFWMLAANFQQVPWPNSGEIDIMENVGYEPEAVHGTIHGPGYSGASGIGNSYRMDDLSAFADDFHTYAIDWDPYVIRWYVDGELFSTISMNDVGGYEWVYDHDFFIIMNVAVGGSWPGTPDETTEMPQQMLIDYVRVYEAASE
ncbi:family 16 glycosylhydrolase [Phototrophicus methaneseepsis]|uniref:Family 16 glycosylhydrolase n=1 Tax=Phototrophicus methaneseepsis TaxID=2710758 RepID=A0A7S8E6K7_9CHLR|nr:family 16 glycosylhydrolase [Phototrophicus methaneseepsis]QPC81295.1 family 16 glycosylhydrolase [Phototrophicus methaneseepsis]